jgi:plastocyanin
VSRRTSLLVLLALLVSLGGAINEAHSTTKPKPKHYKSVKVRDNFYAPDKLTVKPYTKVTWRWPSDDVGGDTHDVKFSRAPKGFKHYQSEPAATDYKYSKLLIKQGTYKIICTFHEGEMEQTIVVRK